KPHLQTHPPSVMRVRCAGRGTLVLGPRVDSTYPVKVPTSTMLPFGLTIFTGAFLLFQVQPLIGKYILPWFGGGPGVWTTCLLFFQVALLGGYAYAHVISQRLKPRTQAIVHLCLVVTALALLPVTPADSWQPRGGENPVLHILT